MLLGSFRIGRVLGFEIRIDYSWFLVFALVVWTFSENEFPRQLPGYGPEVYYAMGIAGALVFFVSVLLHELAHSTVARARGIEVEGITLFIFGGVARTRMEAEAAVDEFLLTIVGPLSSLALAGAFWGISEAAYGLGWPAPVGAVAGFLALLNLILAIFNMLPGFPLDGGRIFRSVVWYLTGNLERATRWATMGGRFFGWALIALGAVELYFGFFLAGLWAAFIGWFLSSAASASYRQFRARHTLAGVPADRAMHRDPPPVAPELPVAELVERYLMRRSESAFPVVRNGAVLGVVGVEEAAGVSPEERRTTTVEEVMRPAAGLPVVDPEESLDGVLSRLRSADGDRALVVEGGRLVGILSLDGLEAWVSRVRALGMEGVRPSPESAGPEPAGPEAGEAGPEPGDGSDRGGGSDRDAPDAGRDAGRTDRDAGTERGVAGTERGASPPGAIGRKGWEEA